MTPRQAIRAAEDRDPTRLRAAATCLALLLTGGLSINAGITLDAPPMTAAGLTATATAAVVYARSLR